MMQFYVTFEGNQSVIHCGHIVSMGQASNRVLKLLQDELLGLKAEYGLSLHLKKGGQGSGSPFPISIKLHIQRPKKYEGYDTAEFVLVLRLQEASLEPISTALGDDEVLPLSGGAIASLVESGSVAAEVLSDELPASLRRRMASEVLRLWAEGGRRTVKNPFGLSGLFKAAFENYGRLLSLIPELIEGYLGVDEHDVTIRRFTILNTEPEDLPAAPSTPTNPPGPATPAGSASAPTTAASSGHHDAPAQRTASAASASDRARAPVFEQPKTPLDLVRYGFPEGLAQELEALGVRSGPMGGLHVAVEEGKEGCVARFSFRMQPSDPTWDRGPLVLEGSAIAASAGAAASQPGSAGCRMWVSGPLTLTRAIRDALSEALEAEVQSGAGRRNQLRRAVTYLEGRAGDIWEQHRARSLAAAAAAPEPQTQTPVEDAGGPAGAQGLDREGSAGSGEEESRDDEGDSEEDSGSSEGGGGDGGADWLDDEGLEGRGGRGESEGEGSQGEEGEQHLGEEQASTSSKAGGAAAAASMPSSNDLTAARLTLEGLKMDGADVLEAYRLTLQAACSRCGAGLDVPLASDAVDATAPRLPNGWFASPTLRCGTCSNACSASFLPKIAHEASNVVAAVKCEGCRPLDLILPNLWGAQCSRCGSGCSLKNLIPGPQRESDARHCRTCHQKVAVSFEVGAFVTRPQQDGNRGGGAASGPAGAGPSSRPKKSGAVAQGAAIFNQPRVLGEPLPGTGVCPHYEHSHRWLRFPCCGKCFPCDLCHEEFALDGHEMKWALRMVCGYCSLEQPCQPECRNCGKVLATRSGAPNGRRTKYWEGGAGQRDKAKLSKNDPNKYKNSKMKTKSRKSERVGEKGAERRAAKTAKTQGQGQGGGGQEHGHD